MARQWLTQAGMVDETGSNQYVFNGVLVEEAAGSVATSDLAASATGTAVLVGASAASGALAASGTGAAAYVGDASSAGVLAASATGTASFTGSAAADSLFSAAGTSSVALVGEFTAATTNLHGVKPRKIRGKRIIFPEELDPPIVEIEIPKPIQNIGGELAAVKQAVIEAQAARDQARRRIDAIERRRVADETERQRVALAAVRARLEAAEVALRYAEAVEAAWFARLRDEDDILLLAA